MKKLILTLFIFLSVSSVSLSQILNPVQWQFGSKKINEKEAVIFVKATMDDGWHIYSLNVPEGGPIKTTFSFKQDDAFSLVGKTLEPEPKLKYEEVFAMNVPYFDKEVVFQQKIRLDRQADVKVRGVVSFAACDAERCLPEDEVEFVVAVK